MSLKDLTWDHHKNAERQEFVKVLMSGKINPELYATYLWNQHKKYDLLDDVIRIHNENGWKLDREYSIKKNTKKNKTTDGDVTYVFVKE